MTGALRVGVGARLSVRRGERRVDRDAQPVISFRDDGLAVSAIQNEVLAREGEPICIRPARADALMQKWLMTDYGFSERGASTFMGQALEHEIANVVNPNFTVVAKMRKTLLLRR